MICSHPTCERPRDTSGSVYCCTHARRKRAGTDMDAPIRPYKAQTACKVRGCRRSHYAKGHCLVHYRQIQRRGVIAANPRHLSQRNRKFKYGLNPAQYDAMVAERNSLCDICQEKHDLQVDHDHACCPGKRSCGECIRGLLCSSCNGRLARYESGANVDRAWAWYAKRYLRQAK